MIQLGLTLQSERLDKINPEHKCSIKERELHTNKATGQKEGKALREERAKKQEA